MADIWTSEHNEIEKLFPDLIFKRLQGGGFNVYLPDRVLSFWFRKRKYGDNRTGQWKKLTGLNIVTDIRNTIDLYLKPVPVISPTKGKIIKEFDDKGTQACIDHITRKILIVENNSQESQQVKTKLTNLLKNVSEELKQSL